MTTFESWIQNIKSIMWTKDKVACATVAWHYQQKIINKLNAKLSLIENNNHTLKEDTKKQSGLLKEAVTRLEWFINTFPEGCSYNDHNLIARVKEVI